MQNTPPPSVAAPAPAPTATGSPAASTLAAGSTAALQHAVRVIATGNTASAMTSHVVLRIAPPGIGSLAVRLTNRGGQVSVVIRADSPAAASAISTTRDAVGQALAGHGLVVGHVGVSSGGAGPSDQQTPGEGRTSGFGNDGATAGSGGSDQGDGAAEAAWSSDTPLPADTRPSTDQTPAARPGREGTWL